MLQAVKRRQLTDDWIWQTIREEAAREAEHEPVLASFLHSIILNHSSLEEALSFHLAGKLTNLNLPSMSLRDIIMEAMTQDPAIGQAVRADIRGVREHDPACSSYLLPLLYYKGLHALEAYRVAHWLWTQERKTLAACFQNRISEVFGVDIHPAAQIGSGVFIDHGTSLVIGETAVVEDEVSMLQEVTLGGTGKESGDRHPKIRTGVLFSAGAKILGNVEVGANAKVGAGSVVLSDVPAGCTVVGVPAPIVGRGTKSHPALEMDHQLPTDVNLPVYEPLEEH
jgi:serine O-acetyltransferase